LQGAVSLRVIQNVFGVVFALAFCVIFYWFMSKKKESEMTVHAE
ncbi:FUSC family protein, partial [Blautia obeum]